MESITVVVPTYNRNEQLTEVLEHLLRSNIDEIRDVEVIVVDDGSPICAQPVVESMSISSPFELKYLQQRNSGPGAARNNGLSNARNELVLFIDDDVLVMPDLLKQHIEAHKSFPKSVVFGPYPYVRPKKHSPISRYLFKLVNDGLNSMPRLDDQRFVKVESVASGNISVEKKMFGTNLYNSALKTPAAEEFDLMLRLRIEKIPIWMGIDMLALHTQPISLAAKCAQEYKYGVGISEVAICNPRSLELEGLAKMFEENCEIRKSDALHLKFKKLIKFLISSNFNRKTFLSLVNFVQIVLPIDFVLFPLFRFLISLSFFSGVRDGIKRFRS